MSAGFRYYLGSSDGLDGDQLDRKIPKEGVGFVKGKFASDFSFGE